jgi:caspase domain-containing protein
MKLLPALVLAFCLPAGALVRLAIVVGNNAGLADEKTLSFATRDAEQVYAALLQLGGADKGQGVLLLDADAGKVRAALKDAGRRLHSLKAQGQKVQVLIYFSGHGSDEALHMNGEKMPLDEIRAYFGEIEADFKLLIADACFGGSLIQAKGALLADAFPIRYQDDLKVSGSAILTSSSAGELSQESRELQGSLFTHYLLSALRGAADFDRDGKITLWEAFNHTQASLRRKLAGVKNSAQTPEFDVDVHGSDNVVLTRVDLGQALLTLKGLPEGEYRIFEAVSALQVAEVRLSDPEGMVLALPRAPYLVYQGQGERRASGFADLRRSRAVSLGPRDFNPVRKDALSAKGGPHPGAFGPGPDYPMPPLQIALRPRLYTAFPGRDASSALALDAALHLDGTRWGAAASFAYLPKARIRSGGETLEQDGYGVAAELRYYWRRSRAGAVFLGPRAEAWSVGQVLNGREYGRAGLLGAFAGLGLERALPYSFSLAFSAEAGMFLSRDGRGDPRRTPSFPLGFALRYGP